MPRPLILGLSGPIGSGVTTVSNILASKGLTRVSLSDPIKAELRKKHSLKQDHPLISIPNWRQELQNIGDKGRTNSGSYWVETAIPASATNKDLVIDGLRNFAEVDYLRDRYPNFFLLGIVASFDTRWQRMKTDYQGNMALFERDDARDSEDKDDLPHGQQVGRCVLSSDYILINDDNNLGSKDTRERKISEVLCPDVDLVRGTTTRHPHDHEVHMAAAYALSHSSFCLKRHVGAVIVDQNGIPLSSGYNENPIGMNPCVREFGTCYKDDLMHLGLERLQGIRCPSCGKELQKLAKPWKCPHCSEDLKRRFYPSRNMELCTAIHAEERAIRSLHGRSAKGCTMYVTTFPCFQCARYIVDVGINRVVYVEAYPVKEAQEYMMRNKIMIEPFYGFKARAFNLIFKQVE